jgi:hypothetical protein
MITDDWRTYNTRKDSNPTAVITQSLLFARIIEPVALGGQSDKWHVRCLNYLRYHPTLAR